MCIGSHLTPIAGFSPQLHNPVADLLLLLHMYAHCHANYICIKHTAGLPVRCNLSAGELKCNLWMWRSCRIGRSEAADLQPEAEVCLR